MEQTGPDEESPEDQYFKWYCLKGREALKTLDNYEDRRDFLETKNTLNDLFIFDLQSQNDLLFQYMKKRWGEQFANSLLVFYNPYKSYSVIIISVQFQFCSLAMKKTFFSFRFWASINGKIH